MARGVAGSEAGAADREPGDDRPAATRRRPFATRQERERAGVTSASRAGWSGAYAGVAGVASGCGVLLLMVVPLVGGVGV